MGGIRNLRLTVLRIVIGVLAGIYVSWLAACDSGGSGGKNNNFIMILDENCAETLGGSGAQVNLDGEPVAVLRPGQERGGRITEAEHSLQWIVEDSGLVLQSENFTLSPENPTYVTTLTCGGMGSETNAP